VKGQDEAVVAHSDDESNSSDSVAADHITDSALTFLGVPAEDVAVLQGGDRLNRFDVALRNWADSEGIDPDDDDDKLFQTFLRQLQQYEAEVAGSRRTTKRKRKNSSGRQSSARHKSARQRSSVRSVFGIFLWCECSVRAYCYVNLVSGRARCPCRGGCGAHYGRDGGGRGGAINSMGDREFVLAGSACAL
jgi:hypothetical protein